MLTSTFCVTSGRSFATVLCALPIDLALAQLVSQLAVIDTLDMLQHAFLLFFIHFCTGFQTAGVQASCTNGTKRQHCNAAVQRSRRVVAVHQATRTTPLMKVKSCLLDSHIVSHAAVQVLH